MVTMVKPLLDGLLSVQYALSDLDLLIEKSSLNRKTTL